MSFLINDEQLFYDCCFMDKSQFGTVYISWFNWNRVKSNIVYRQVREFIVDNEVFVNEDLKKSRKNRDDRPQPKKTPRYKSFQI